MITFLHVWFKTAAKESCLPTMNIVNQTIRDAKFPLSMKLSDIAPIFKTSDVLDTDNYRPVNVLPCLSKIVERIYYEQLYAFFSDILSTFLAAFRRMNGGHHVLTKLLHDCKKALDEGLSVGIILMDLSKAFDCIPYGLLLTKLKCYGLSDQACPLLKSGNNGCLPETTGKSGALPKWMGVSCTGCPPGIHSRTTYF